jgi:hypothetical protein
MRGWSTGLESYRFDLVIINPKMGQDRNKAIPQSNPVILSSEKGQSQNDLLTILLDEGELVWDTSARPEHDGARQD